MRDGGTCFIDFMRFSPGHSPFYAYNISLIMRIKPHQTASKMVYFVFIDKRCISLGFLCGEFWAGDIELSGDFASYASDGEGPRAIDGVGSGMHIARLESIDAGAKCSRARRSHLSRTDHRADATRLMACPQGWYRRAQSPA